MHPVAFKIFDFPIYFYGVMMVVAYMVYLAVIKYTIKYENLPLETAVDLSIYAIIGGVAGARIAYVLQNISRFAKEPAHVFFIREGGLSWHGALIGGVLALLIYHWIKKAPFAKITDFMSVMITLALAIGRIGCFLNGCCYGRECKVPWAVEFTGAGLHGHRHPTQLYESLMLVICFFFLLWWWKRKKFDGEMTLMMFGTYGMIRFVVEFFRDNTPNQYPGDLGLSIAQYFSIFLIIVCFAVIFFLRSRIEGTVLERASEGATSENYSEFSGLKDSVEQDTEKISGLITGKEG